MEEIWKDVPEFNGFYQVSNLGNVRSEKLIRKQSTNRRGYLAVTYKLSGLTKRIETHRLVAILFVDNPLLHPIVNHKDCDKSNNNSSNLEWCTYQMNTHHASDNNRFEKSSKRPCKIGIIESLKIREMYKNGGHTQRSLANLYGVCNSSINQILNYKSYKK